MRSSVHSVDMLLKPKPKPELNASARRLSSRTQWALFIGGLVVHDILMVALGFRLAYFTRFEVSLSFFQLDVTPEITYYQRVVLLLIPLWLVIFSLMGLYDRRNLLGGTREYSQVLSATATGMMMIVIISFLEPGFVLSRGWLLLSWLFTFLLVATGRFWLRRVVYTLRQKGYFLTPALILGTNQEATLLGEQLQSWKTSGLYIVGFVANNGHTLPPTAGPTSILGGVEQLDDIIRRFNIEELILATSAFTREEMLKIFKRYGVSSAVNLRLSSGLFEIITTGLQVKELAYVPLVSVNKVRLTGLDRILKLALDFSLTIPGLVVLSPVMFLIGLLIKLDSPGPVLHRRRVMGVNNRQFDAFKFRTMHINGDEILEQYPHLKQELAHNHKLRDDPRVTRLGRILRKFSLDELPQLLNVLKRDMSLVGPRMISPEEMKNYNHWGLNLLTVRPGITGLWQVSGRSDISYEERVRLDMHYIRNWNIWLDLQLLIQTIPVVIKGTGAY